MARKRKNVLPEMTQSNTDIVHTLVGYKTEAELNRKGGPNNRDSKWEDNNDQYWNRVDFSNKADWQAKVTMPDVPSFVDRFAAAMKDALVSTPAGFYTVSDPYDTENNMAEAIKRMEDVWLSVIGRNQNGHLLGFPAVFEEQCKLGALMAMSGVVTWKNDVKDGRVAFETVDPRNVWLDHTYRNLYRIRRTEVDLHDIGDMIGMTSSKGRPIFDTQEMANLIASFADNDAHEREQLTGHGQKVTSARKPVILDEYLATVTDKTGKVVQRDGLFVVANDKFLVRGPEDNPYWHGRDWLVYAPLITTPLSVYGRSYMEDIGSISKTFNEVTNLLIDAVHMSAMNAFAIVPTMLAKPEQANTGVWPNKTFLIEDGYSAKDFAETLQLGSLDQGAIAFWQQIKSTLAEAAGMNEIGMGQLPDKTHIASSAVTGAQQSQSAVIRSVAQTIETRFIDVVLDLTWKTGLQHLRASDTRMQAAAGDELFAALIANRRDLASRPITFQARGISQLIQKNQQLGAMLNILQVVAQDQNLLAAFMQVVDIGKLVDRLLFLSNIDKTKLSLTEREKLAQSVVQAGQMGAGGAQPSPAAVSAMGEVAGGLGVAR